MYRIYFCEIYILPRFCIERKGLESPLSSFIHIRTFESEFSGKYRENSFLCHPKVPRYVKTGLSEQPLGVDNPTAPHRNLTISRLDIIRRFGNVKAEVLVINSVYSVNVVLGKSNEDFAFTEKLRRAFLPSEAARYSAELHKGDNVSRWVLGNGEI